MSLESLFAAVFGALLLGAQGFKLSTLLARTLFLLAACLLGAQSLKLGAFIIA